MVEKIGPYRVYERLGVGGMGEVFKAYDDRLDRWVAIKRIRPDREDAEDNRERFKREARATARLNHPAIVHLYGIFQEGDSDCIVMEYVEGRTLDAILAEGPLDPLRVASLGNEIASGLAEAHANGILHRDLKAENIIITPRGRSKILDFGLAKPILRSELDPVLTGKGQLVGTSRAMSPEYVSGDNVDHRSDLFALGVLLYETLTGQSPFKAHNTLATLKQVMLHKQMPVKQISPKVPQELSDLIDRLLEKGPADRPQSAHEVALAFGRLTGQISSGIVDQPMSGAQPVFKPTTSTGATFSASDTVLDLRPRSRWMTVVAVLLALLVTAFFLGRYLSKPATTEVKRPVGEPVKVVLGDFKNSTSEEKFDVTVAELFRTSLEQSEAISLLSNVQIREALGRMQQPPDSKIDSGLGAELAQREGAKWLIVGSISRIGSKFAISAQIVRPQDQVARFTKSDTADNEDGIIAAVQKVGQEVRAELGETAAAIESSSIPLERVTTPNFEALRAFTIASEKYSQGGAQNQEALTLLKHALDLDPSFAMAHAKLVAIYSAQSDPQNALVHTKAALENRDRLTEVEKFYVNGWAFRWTGTPQDVLRNWSQMSDLHPKELPGHRNLGLALWIYENEFQSAAVAFEKALAVASPSQKPGVAQLLGYCFLGSGQSEKARSYFELAATTNKWPLVYFLLATNSRSEAEELALKTDADPSKMALVHADRGDLSRAETELKNALSAAPGFEPQIRADLGAIFYFEGKKSEFLELARETSSSIQPHLATVGLATENSPLTLLALLGKLLARFNEVEQANHAATLAKLAAGEIKLPLWSAHLKMLQAEILMAEQHHQEALRLLDSALSEADLVTLHESKATCLEQMHQRDAAIAEWQQVAGLHAQAFAQGQMSSWGQMFNVVSTRMAHRAIERLAQENGDLALVNQQRQALTALWPSYLP